MAVSDWLPWASAIVITILICGTVIATVGAKHGIKAEVKKEEINAMNTFSTSATDLTKRLDALDERLARIEKTLNDIP